MHVKARPPLRRLVVITALLAALAILAVLLAGLASPAILPVDDFVEYWAAGRLNAIGGNPYAADQLRALETQAGWPADQFVVMMWNPPWTLTLAMPFGRLSYPLGRLAWLGLHFVLVLTCSGWLWRYYGGDERRGWLAWLVSLTFVPTLFVLRMGQIGPLLLLGLTGFLYFERRRQGFWAGMALFLIAVKPHLLYLIWIALALWALDRKRLEVLGGVVVAAVCTLMLPMAANPALLPQYLHSAADSPPFYWATPTLGAVLRFLAGSDKSLLQFVPPVFGLAWLLCYWQRNRHAWRWREQMPLLVLMSVVTAAYGWNYDWVVCLPAVVQIAVVLSGRKTDRPLSLAIAVYIVVDCAALVLDLLVVGEFWYFWMAPALLVCYLLALRSSACRLREATRSSLSVAAGNLTDWTRPA